MSSVHPAGTADATSSEIRRLSTLLDASQALSSDTQGCKQVEADGVQAPHVHDHFAAPQFISLRQEVPADHTIATD